MVVVFWKIMDTRMKNTIYCLSAFATILTFNSCKNDDIEPWGAGPLEEYTVTPINGGAIITYRIPDDPDILYVMAEYERNGETFTEKASVYSNSLRIEGFHNVGEVQARLYKVNKEEQKSDPLEIKFTPGESLISIAKNSLALKTTFGGILASWENPECTELGVRLMTEDSTTSKLETDDMYFSSIPNESHSFRGYEPKKTRFGISFEDKWGNVSDTIEYTATPYVETLVPKPFADYRSYIPYDNATNLSTYYTFSRLWDNIIPTSSSYNGWLTRNGSSGRSFTIDIQRVVKLSRIVTHAYRSQPYGQVNITGYELWGAKSIDYDKLSDPPYWLDEESVRAGAIAGVDPTTELPSKTFKDDWEFLGEFYFPDYRSDATATSAFAASGAEFELNLEAEPVRYLRFIIRQVSMAEPSPNNYFSMGEITLYGDTSVPQE